jgi:hypothetical protein
MIETERAIKLLDTDLQNSYRLLAGNKLKQILNSGNHHNSLQKTAICYKNLNHKHVTENALIVQTDKGKTIVIRNSDEYSKKVRAFLKANINNNNVF